VWQIQKFSAILSSKNIGHSFEHVGNYWRSVEKVLMPVQSVAQTYIHCRWLMLAACFMELRNVRQPRNGCNVENRN